MRKQMKIVTLCGATRFYKTFDNVMLTFTRRGYAVFTIGSHRGKDTDKRKIRGFPVNDSIIETIIKLHEEKILASDYVFIIDVNGYIGTHTRHEIEYAKIHGIPIYYYSRGDLARF